MAPGSMPPGSGCPSPVGAAAQALDEGLEAREVVAAVGVAHDDVAALRGGDAASSAAP
jgi:hypothetical protein